jgi:hypothetical protein
MVNLRSIFSQFYTRFTEESYNKHVLYGQAACIIQFFYKTNTNSYKIWKIFISFILDAHKIHRNVPDSTTFESKKKSNPQLTVEEENGRRVEGGRGQTRSGLGIEVAAVRGWLVGVALGGRCPSPREGACQASHSAMIKIPSIVYPTASV